MTTCTHGLEKSAAWKFAKWEPDLSGASEQIGKTNSLFLGESYKDKYHNKASWPSSGMDIVERQRQYRRKVTGLESWVGILGSAECSREGFCVFSSSSVDRRAKVCVSTSYQTYWHLSFLSRECFFFPPFTAPSVYYDRVNEWMNEWMRAWLTSRSGSTCSTAFPPIRKNKKKQKTHLCLTG